MKNTDKAHEVSLAELAKPALERTVAKVKERAARTGRPIVARKVQAAKKQ